MYNQFNEKKIFLGIDVGSVSTKFVAVDQEGKVLHANYFRTEGTPIRAVKKGLDILKKDLPEDSQISGVGTTGSARRLTGAITGADIIKNEITAHARGAVFFAPDVRTIIEIGGQDSKIIILENGVAVDFAMNLICAAGTGAFLEAQAYRLKIPIEEFGGIALQSKSPTTIGSRCTIFAESDMIHKQQIGHNIKDIIAGLCDGLVRNYLSNVAKGKNIQSPIVFLGGVSENIGIKKSFESVLEKEIIVPEHNKVAGALGAALLVRDRPPEKTKFFGFDVSGKDIMCTSFRCSGCPNRCEVIEARIEKEVIARWGDRCGKWSF